MLTRKPLIACSTYPLLFSLPSKSQTSSAGPSQRRFESTRPRPNICTRCRTISKNRKYATIARHESEPPKKNDIRQQHEWPNPPKGQIHPTPYQIFSMKMNAPYTKARYYELVKLYHPDLSNPTSTPSDPAISPKTRMERYRLIVAAHTILSDPAKRTAYDRFGAGWNGRAEFPSFTSSPSASPDKPGPFSHSWTTPNSSDPIWSNATWEDWERFYDRREREQNGESARPAPLYMSNASFLALVAMLAMLGSSMNYNRAQDAGTYFVEQRDLVHDRAAKELRKVRQETAGLRGRDERIQWFIRQREATMGAMSGTDVEAFRDEKAERLLGERDVCTSGRVGDEEG